MHITTRLHVENDGTDLAAWADALVRAPLVAAGGRAVLPFRRRLRVCYCPRFKLSPICLATLCPDSSMPPKIGPMRGPP